jgi:membrane protein
VLWRTWSSISNDRVTLIAAGVTYYILLSLVPTLAAFVSLYGLFSDPATVNEHVSGLAVIVPEGGMAIIDQQLTRLSSQGGTTLGWALAVSLGIALWSASNGVKAMFEAMNVAYGEKEKRNFLHLNALALLFTLGGVVAAIVMIAIVVAIPLVLGFLGVPPGLGGLVQGSGYVLLAILLFVGIAAIYRFGPSREQAQWQWVSPGAVLSVVLILVASLLFSWYAANFANFEKTYGSLGALIGLLTWMWISATVVIVGAELNAESERQTARDSTIGEGEPMGERGAVAADTLGKATPEGGDPTEGMSPEWRAGYRAAQAQARPRERKLTAGALLFALPASLALHALDRRRRCSG